MHFAQLEQSYHLTNMAEETGSKSPFVYGPMTKMATRPIQCKRPLKPSLKSKGESGWDIICSIENVGSTKFSQMMILG